MPESLDDSVTGWIDAMKRGDEAAAAALWARFFDRVVALARVRMAGVPRRISDEEDVAVSVFASLCRGAVAGRFADLSDHDDLWRLLAAITNQKTVDQRRRHSRQKRGGGAVRGDSALAAGSELGLGFDGLAADVDDPAFVVEMDEEYRRLLAELRDDSLRRVVALRMEGFTNSEIATTLGVTERAIERKLQLIRSRWRREVEGGD